MNQRWATFWVLLASLSAGSALAQAAPGESRAAVSALRIYRLTTQRMLTLCSDLVVDRGARSKPASAPPAYRACVSRALDDSTVRLDEAVRCLPEQESVRALRDYQITFQRALFGIAPQAGESDSAYDERQVFLFHRLAHAWARFELAETVAQ